jgi:hypothetical protein
METWKKYHFGACSHIYGYKNKTGHKSMTYMIVWLENGKFSHSETFLVWAFFVLNDPFVVVHI